MEFGIEKCVMLVMQKEKIVKSVGIEFPDGKVIQSLQEGGSYKLFTIYGALHPKSDVDRLHVPKNKGGVGLISIQDCVEFTIRGLEVNVHGIEQRLMQAARGDKIDGLEAASVLKR